MDYLKIIEIVELAESITGIEIQNMNNGDEKVTLRLVTIRYY